MSETQELLSGVIGDRPARPSRYTGITLINLLSYLVLCLGTIALMVFLSATQSFVLGDIFGVGTNTGRYVGTLGFVDEITVICLSPLWGTLSDRIGARPVAVVGALAMATGLLLYTEAPNIYPWLLLCRVLFATGASAATAMITAILAQMGRYNVDLRALVTGLRAWRHPTRPLVQADLRVMNNRGKLAGLVGTATGLGAVLAVTLLLPLPTRFDTEPSQPAVALRRTYNLVGSLGLLTALIYFWGLSRQDSVEKQETEPTRSYLSLLQSGFAVARTDPAARQAYLGAFVARATTVITTVFIPMAVHAWYLKSGKCNNNISNDDFDSAPLRESCHGAYIQAAILSGVINTCALIAAPIWGFAIDRFALDGGARRGLVWSSSLGFVASVGLVLSMVWADGNPTTLWGFMAGALLGIGEIGVIITSMSLCTSEEKSGSLHRAYAGAMAGVYSFSGGMGILTISIIGGNWFDLWSKGPFVLLTICYLGLFVVSKF